MAKYGVISKGIIFYLVIIGLLLISLASADEESDCKARRLHARYVLGMGRIACAPLDHVTIRLGRLAKMRVAMTMWKKGASQNVICPKLTS